MEAERARLASCLAAIALMDASRVALGVHYVSDVLAGDALEILVTWCAWHAFMRIRRTPRLVSKGSAVHSV